MFYIMILMFDIDSTSWLKTNGQSCIHLITIGHLSDLTKCFLVSLIIMQYSDWFF